MNKVIIESPYAGNIERNIEYARLCIKHSLKIGEAPIASHLLYTQEGILDDNDPLERLTGMKAGWEWMSVADLVVFYIDLGVSNGMIEAFEQAVSNNACIQVRSIHRNESYGINEVDPVLRDKLLGKTATMFRGKIPREEFKH